MQYFPSLIWQNRTTNHIVSKFDWPFLIDSFADIVLTLIKLSMHNKATQKQ